MMMINDYNDEVDDHKYDNNKDDEMLLTKLTHGSGNDDK
jgi:hypothetical protein